jgi:preprotein translocase subunit SecF
MFHVRQFSRTVVVVAIGLVVMMEMLVAVDRAANDFQAVMMAGVRGKHVQPLPE